MMKLLTVKDLAELFGKHENTIYKWIVDDHLFPHAFRVKDGWFVPLADVRKLMQQNRVSSNGDKPPGMPQPRPVRDGFVKRW